MLIYALNWTIPSFTFMANGTNNIGDIETSIVDVKADDAAIHWYVDPKTGHGCVSISLAIGRKLPFQSSG